MDFRVVGTLMACLGLLLVVAAGGVVGTDAQPATESVEIQDSGYIDIDAGELSPDERQSMAEPSGDGLELHEVSPGDGPADEPGIYVIDVSNLTSIYVEASGPGGGGAGYDPDDDGAAKDGGDGGYVEGEFDVSAFDQIQVVVGVGGGGGDIIYGGGLAGSGFFDGGAGGWQTNQTAGGGGGGVTAVLGVTSSGDSTPLVAAGGGGGGSAWDSGNPITPSSESGGGGGAAGGVGGSTGAVGGSDGVDAEDSNGTVDNSIGGDGAEASDTGASDGYDGGAWVNPDYVEDANITVGAGGSGGEGAAAFDGELGAPGESGAVDWQDTGGPALQLQSIDYPDNVSVGQDLTVDYTITNIGGEEGTESAVELVTGGAVEDTDTNVTVAPGENKTGTLVIESVDVPSAVELVDESATDSAVTDGGVAVDGEPDIDPTLEDASGETRALVYLAPAQLSPETDSGAVVEKLQAHADRTQPAVEADLEAMDGVEVEGSFWIVNALSVTYDADTLSAESLATPDGVVGVYKNYEIEEPEPIVEENPGTEATGDYTYGLEQIGAPTVWDEYGTQGEGSVVVIQDNGFQVDHEALTFEEAHAIDGNGNIAGDPQVGDHGTHVAGTATGGEDPDGVSIGVAPNAELHGHDIFSEGAVLGASIGSIQMAAEMDADVVSGSWGSGCNNAFPDPVYNDDMIDPIANARAAGTEVVASSGNAFDCVGGFGNDFESFSVGATDSNEDVTGFSSGSLIDKDSGHPNYDATPWNDPPAEWPQSWVEPRVSAPGNNVYSSIPGDEYTDGFSGTSMAAPHVAGAIGLIQSATDSDFTGPEIREALVETAGKPSDWDPSGEDIWTNSDSTHDQPGIDSRYGYGIVDLPAAVDYLQGSMNTLQFTVQLSDYNDSMTGETVVEDDGGADLQLQSIDAPAEVAPSDDLNVEYTIENVGDAEGTESFVNLSVDGTLADPDDSDTDVTVSAGGTQSGTLTFTNVDDEFNDGDTISFSVDLADFGDSASGTTVVNDSSGGPSVQIQSLNYPDGVQFGENLTVDYTLENTGGEDATESFVDLLVNGTDAAFDDTDENVDVPAGDTTTGTLTLDSIESYFEPGDEITFTVQLWDFEDTEGGSTTVEVPDGPLLELQSIDAPGTISSGNNFTVEYTIANIGGAEGTESAVNLLVNNSLATSDEDVTVPAQGTASGTLTIASVGQLETLLGAAEASEPASRETGVRVDVERGTGVTDALVTLGESDTATTPAALQAHASQSQEPLLAFAGAREDVTVERQFWVTNAALVTVDTDSTALRELAALPGVESIIPNAEVEALSSPTPAPPAALQSSDVGPTDHGNHTYGLEQINAPDVWEQYGTQGEGASIAVLDTGVDADHPDIDLAKWAEFNESGAPVDSDPQDFGAHGTHVSGTATGGSASGTHIGVAPEADLYHAAVLTDCEGPCGGTFAQIFAGIQWAVDENADVISMSLGAPGYFPDMIEPVRNAIDAGTTVVSSSGNSGPDTSGSPGNIYDVISVGASDESQDIGGFSSGEEIDTASAWGADAPGDWPSKYVVPSVSAPGVSVLSSVPGGGYDGTYDGTSMAAPHVSGVVALAESATDEKLSPAIVEQGLELTAFKPDSAPVPPGSRDTRYGSGIVDALSAVEFLEDPPEGEFVQYTVELGDTGDSLGGEVFVEGPSVPPMPGQPDPPTDPDGDGLFEDADGDGKFDIFDVQMFFTYYDHEMIDDHSAAFDFDDNGKVDIFDVQAQFDEL